MTVQILRSSCSTGQGEQHDRSDASDTPMDPVRKPGEWCHPKTLPHGVQLTTSLGCIQRNIPTVMSIAVYGTEQKTRWGMTTTRKRKTEKEYNRIFLPMWAIQHVRSAQNLSVDQLQWLFSIWQRNVLCLLFSLPHLLMLSLLSWQISIFACILQLGNTRFWNSVFLSIYIILVTRQNLILSDVKMMR